jgi:hypothetical protein
MLRKAVRPLLALPFVLWAYSVTHAQLSCTLLGASSGNGGTTPATQSGRLAIINSLTGVPQIICTLNPGIGGMAQHPHNGILYGVTAPGFVPPSGSHRFLVTINPQTCAETVIGDINRGNFGIADLAFGIDDALYAWSENSDDLIMINTFNGNSRVIANAAISTFGSGLEFGPNGGTLYLAGNGGGGVLRTVNLQTGTTTVVASLSGSPAPGFPISALAWGFGQMWAAHKVAFPPASVDNLVTINIATGQITNIGTSLPKLDALAWYCATAAPTFGTWQTLMLTIVLVSAAYWQLRRRKHIIV